MKFKTIRKFILAILAFCIVSTSSVVYAGELTYHKLPIMETDRNTSQEEIPIEETEIELFLIDVTEEEIDILARVVMSEASTLEYDAKVAVAQTVVNRVRSDYREFKKLTTVTDVVYAPNQFSTQDNGEPNEDCYNAVYQALKKETFSTDMLWFRKGFVKYGNEYKEYGEGKRKTYFSTVSERGKDE